MKASEVVIIARPIVIGPPRVSRYLLLWPLFFVICFGLGFPTLARYNPKDALGDTKAYYKLVTGVSTPEFAEYSQRLLVPYVAQPFYRAARGRVGSWDPVLFGLLVSNSLFLAGTAFLLVNIGCEVLGDYVSSLLGALLYLLNFSVSNFHLSGMVDSSQAFVMVAIFRTLMTADWRPLIPWAFFGALSKETTVPLSIAVAFGWWLESGRDRRRALWVAAAAAVGFATLTILMLQNSPYLPWSFAASQQAPGPLWANALRCFFNHEFLYVFVWLAPLGIARITTFPKPWIAASFAGILASVLMGAYSDAAGNTVRPMFNAAGPLLSLSAATFISRLASAKAAI